MAPSPRIKYTHNRTKTNGIPGFRKKVTGAGWPDTLRGQLGMISGRRLENRWVKIAQTVDKTWALSCSDEELQRRNCTDGSMALCRQ